MRHLPNAVCLFPFCGAKLSRRDFGEEIKLLMIFNQFYSRYLNKLKPAGKGF